MGSRELAIGEAAARGEAIQKGDGKGSEAVGDARHLCSRCTFSICPTLRTHLLSSLEGKSFGELGSDQLEFYFSPNRGEPPKPLARIASGGELSRLMLAIKSLALTDGGSPTLLFDEVDAGIGGSIAEIVGKKLKQVATSHQILCVTHLPQIAALADSHHIVRKEVVKDRTSTTVDKLKQGERIEEVARMLGGIKITERTRRHAEEMVRSK